MEIQKLLHSDSSTADEHTEDEQEQCKLIVAERISNFSTSPEKKDDKLNIVDRYWSNSKFYNDLNTLSTRRKRF